MPIENSHPLLQIIAGHVEKQEQKQPEALASLKETLRLIGADNISHLDLSNIAHIVDVSSLSQGPQPALVQPAETDNANEQFQVFARTSPVRTSQLAGGLNQFLAGTAVNSIGPFVVKPLPPFFIDFIRTQRSIALFIQGNPTPLILF